MPPSIAIVTKTYAPDLERCELLCRSLDVFAPHVEHWIIVDRHDRARFAHLEGSSRRVVSTEEVLPRRVMRVSLERVLPRRNIWLSPSVRPMRGWLVQQLAKFAIARDLEADVTLHVDSDIVFMKRLADASLVDADGSVRLYLVPDAVRDPSQEDVTWHRTAERLLGLAPREIPLPNYIGGLITWRRDVVDALLRRIETISGRDWTRTLASAWTVSEYTIYGRFASDGFADQGGHHETPESLCHYYWPDQAITAEELDRFLDTSADSEVAVMINPKAGMSASWYGPLIERRWSSR